jgi:hypothetical protein
LRQQGIEFVELGLRGVIMRKSSSRSNWLMTG